MFLKRILACWLTDALLYLRFVNLFDFKRFNNFMSFSIFANVSPSSLSCIASLPLSGFACSMFTYGSPSRISRVFKKLLKADPFGFCVFWHRMFAHCLPFWILTNFDLVASSLILRVFKCLLPAAPLGFHLFCLFACGCNTWILIFLHNSACLDIFDVHHGCHFHVYRDHKRLLPALLSSVKWLVTILPEIKITEKNSFTNPKHSNILHERNKHTCDNFLSLIYFSPTSNNCTLQVVVKTSLLFFCNVFFSSFFWLV